MQVVFWQDNVGRDRAAKQGGISCWLWNLANRHPPRSTALLSGVVVEPGVALR